MTLNRIKGIFFDAGNTLLRVHPSIGVIYSEAAQRFGQEVPPDLIEQSFKKHWENIAPLVGNEGHRLTFEKERDWWKRVVRDVFDQHAQLDDFDLFFDYLYMRFAQSDVWKLYEDVPPVLKRLRDKKLKLAIISNWDSRLPSICQQLGIDSFFDAVIVSSVVGYEKPHPAIFHIALEQTGLLPHEAVYVGDDPFLDYQAAKKVGFDSLHLDRTGRFVDHPDKITTLFELVQRLDPNPPPLPESI